MPRDRPHPYAYFSLVPLNEQAKAVLNHPDNAHHVSVFPNPLPEEGGMLSGLDIGFHIGSKSRSTLVTIGRCGDILVEGPAVSRIQCSFEMHEDTAEIMLQDRSSNQSTQFFGQTAMPFESWRPHRRVVVDRKTNLAFGFGGVACDLYQFRVFWHHFGELGAQMTFDCREDNPRQARTVLDQPQTEVSSQRVTRIHTPANSERIRFSERKELGKGSFGEVFWAANVDSGKHVAVKKVKRSSQLSHAYIMLKREVETLSRISHANVVEYLSAQWEGDDLCIFMELKSGNVENLTRTLLYAREPRSAVPLLHHMLQALDYLAYEGIIHRDIKPENILYTPLSVGGYKYQLADFGLSTTVTAATTQAGSALYMAPELVTNPKEQTQKVDIWSLFVTLVYVMNINGFWEKNLDTLFLRVQTIQEATNTEMLHPLRDMAAVDPSQRATAADMLDKVFGGEGRSSPHNHIHPNPYLSERPDPTNAKKRSTKSRGIQDNDRVRRSGRCRIVTDGVRGQRPPGAFQGAQERPGNLPKRGR